MELPHVRRANDPAELLRLLRDWEAGGCASALSRLFVLFAAGHPWGTEAAEEVLLPRLPSAGCLITAAFSLSDKHAATPELAALFPEVVGGGKEPVLVRVGPTSSACCLAARPCCLAARPCGRTAPSWLHFSASRPSAQRWSRIGATASPCTGTFSHQPCSRSADDTSTGWLSKTQAFGLSTLA
jgi:hypothetical protein